jgi:undecaprenyl-diphosphatase
MLLVGALNLSIYKLLKPRIARPRPYVGCPGIRACARSLDEFSFPSGHVMHAVAFSVLIGAAYPSFIAVAWSFTLLVALSRVVLGLHYPSDVAFGAAIGLIGAELVELVI